MDSWWKRAVVGVVLWGSPALIVLGTIAIGVFLQKVRHNFGAMRSTAGVTAIAGLVVLAVHAGYFMTPLVHGRGHGKEVLAIVLMGLAAVVVFGGGFLLLTNTSLSEDLAKQSGGLVGLALVGLLALAVYAGPIIVLLVD